MQPGLVKIALIDLMRCYAETELVQVGAYLDTWCLFCQVLGEPGTHPIWERQRGQCSKCRQLADGVEFLAAALECEERVRVTVALKKLNCRRYTVSVPSMIFFEMNSRRWRNLEEKIDHGHQHHCIRNNTLDEKQRASRVRHTWRYVPRTIFWASVAAEWLSQGMAPQSKEEEEPAVPAWVPGRRAALDHLNGRSEGG